MKDNDLYFFDNSNSYEKRELPKPSNLPQPMDDSLFGDVRTEHPRGATTPIPKDDNE